MLLSIKSLWNRFALIGGAFLFLVSAQESLHATWLPLGVVSDPNLPNSSLGGPVLRMDPQGNAIAVFNLQYSYVFDYASAIGSAYYIRGIGWQPPQVISSLAVNTADVALYNPQADASIALNSTGYAVAGWEGNYRDDNFPDVVITAVRNSNGIWNPVQIISDTSGNIIANQINVTLNEAGTALAAWVNGDTQDPSPEPDFVAVSFLPFGGSWTAPYAFPKFSQPGRDGKPYPFINPSGDAVVTWYARQENPLRFYIKVATYDAGTTTWSAPVDLDMALADDFGENPRCSMDDNGNAVAIWTLNEEVKVSTFDGSSWSSAITLGATIGNTDGVCTVVLDPRGNATAVWEGPLPERYVYASSRPLGGTWSAPQVISRSGSTFNSFEPFMSQEPLAVNLDGDVIATWLEQDTDTVMAAYKPFGFPWRAAEVVQGVNNNKGYLNIGIASCGFAMALWQRGTDVEAAVNENLILPLNALGSQCCQKFATQKRCVSILTWSPDNCVLSYNIYRDGALIANVLNTGGALKYIDPYKKKDSVYTITAISIWGFEGDPVPFIFN